MYHWITIILSIILLILLLSAVVHKCQGKLTVSRFLNIEAKNAYPSLVKELGQPQIIVNQPGGFVMWFPRQSDPSVPFSNVILKDSVLTLDFKNNKFFQVEIDSATANEDAFNTFAKAQLAKV